MRKKILYRGRYYDVKGEITSKILHFEGIHMKLVEALILRADAQKLLEQLKHRLVGFSLGLLNSFDKRSCQSA